MKEGFLKKSFLMMSGNFYLIFIGLISTAIYVRTIGLDGYTILGISIAFFGLADILDIPMFLNMIKFNYKHVKKSEFIDMFNTAYIFKHITNLLIVIILLPAILYLSIYIYKDVSLVLFLFIGLLTYLVNRIIIFLEEFLRANYHEHIIQKSLVTKSVLDFCIALILLFIFQLGVLSIFISRFIASIFQMILIQHLIKKDKIVAFRAVFDKGLIKKSFSEFILGNYAHRIISTLISRGLFFLSTFFLGTRELGLLTIFISIKDRLGTIFSSLWTHLTPLISTYSKLNNKKKVITLCNNITRLLNLGWLVGIIIILSLGKYLFGLYFGESFIPSFHIFLIYFLPHFFSYLFLSYNSYLFTTNIKKYLWIHAIMLFTGIVLFVPAVKYLNILGYALIFFIMYMIRSLYFIMGHIKLCNKKMEVFDYLTIIFALSSLIICIVTTSSLLKQFFIVIFSSILIFFMLNIDLKKNFKTILRV